MPKPEWVVVKPYGTDWKKLVQDILKVELEEFQGGSYHIDVQIKGTPIRVENWRYSRSEINGIELSLRDTNETELRRRTQVVLGRIDAAKLREKYEELQALSPEITDKLRLQKEKEDREHQAKEAIYKECGYFFELTQYGDEPNLFYRLDMNLTADEAIAIGKVLKSLRDNVAKPAKTPLIESTKE